MKQLQQQQGFLPAGGGRASRSQPGAHVCETRLLRRRLPSILQSRRTMDQYDCRVRSQDMLEEALRMCTRMRQQDGLTPDSVTYAVLVQGRCSGSFSRGAAARRDGQQWGGVRTYGAVVGSALVNMYAKCGRLDASERVFDSFGLSEWNVEAWGALVYGYARQGDSQVLLDLIDRMGSEGVRPNEVMFLSALTVCSHGVQQVSCSKRPS